MRYLGGKTQLARIIAETIRDNRGGRDMYFEPFLGGGSVAELVAPTFPIVVLSDIHPDLIAMWRAVASGWTPPVDITRAEYNAARLSYLSGEPANALRGFIGFGCSFGGKWFGGWAQSGTRNYADESARSVTRTGRALSGASIICAPYEEMEILGAASPRAVVYADPPYRGTTEYSDRVDHDLFWDNMDSWVDAGAQVFVSEYTAPPTWRVVWERDQPVNVGGQGRRLERLYTKGLL